jgi:hypothetical protein
MRSQDGQCLADDVLGIVALFLKADGQDLSCANLNMASRTLRAETMRTLWDVIVMPRLHGSRFRGNDAEYKAFLQRTLESQGAKYTRYVKSSLLPYSRGPSRNPDVHLNLPSADTFFIPGMRSWTAKLFKT